MVSLTERGCATPCTSTRKLLAFADPVGILGTAGITAGAAEFCDRFDAAACAFQTV